MDIAEREQDLQDAIASYTVAKWILEETAHSFACNEFTIEQLKYAIWKEHKDHLDVLRCRLGYLITRYGENTQAPESELIAKQIDACMAIEDPMPKLSDVNWIVNDWNERYLCMWNDPTLWRKAG